MAKRIDVTAPPPEHARDGWPKDRRWHFNPVWSTNKPEKEVVVRYVCPRGYDHRVCERAYPDLDPPARFLDCVECAITWDVAGLSEPEPGTDHWDGMTSQQRYEAFMAGVAEGRR